MKRLPPVSGPLQRGTGFTQQSLICDNSFHTRFGNIKSWKFAACVAGFPSIRDMPELTRCSFGRNAHSEDPMSVAFRMQDTSTDTIADEPHNRAAADVMAALDTREDAGLTQAEAERRLLRYGRNELASVAPRPGWLKFLDQFTALLVLLLLAAAAISFGLWLYERNSTLPYEAMAIVVIVILNACMGYIQEARAERAAAALREMSAARANIVRGGARHSVPAAALVPGDIILVEEGDTIPADARLFQATALQTAEAALTGESLPVSKDIAAIAGNVELGDRHNMVFSGTAAVYGHGRAVVTATGMRTQMGRIADLLEKAPAEVTPLQRELDRVGKLLAITVVAIAAAMIGTIFLISDVHGFSEVFDVLILGVALAVAAVPEGLPAIVTAVLSLGVQRMARRNAIIRRLAAVEALGSATVIASDKTGTLTRNEMTVRRVATASGCANLSGTGYVPRGEVSFVGAEADDDGLQFELDRALMAAERANNAGVEEDEGVWSAHGDPTEAALIVAARKAGLSAESLEARFPRVGEVPFSSERKLMSTVHADAERQDRLIALTKGAPDVLLKRCSHELVGRDAVPLTDVRRAEIMASNDTLAAEALRTLGVAFRSLPPDAPAQDGFQQDAERDLVFLGLIGMIDPPRQEAREAIARAAGAGIRSIMITGDHPKTAAIIAAELGIGSGQIAVTGAQIATMSDSELDRIVETVSVYARVNPEHKLRIVAALQRAGETVAMTGDGVNDAPALKAADIGVAMGITGTDVSKEAADMVLADDNFATIVAAVEEGRAIFLNIRKFLRYLLSSNIGEVATMFFGVLFADMIGLSDAGEGSLVLPLLATQILWINLVTDGAPALAIGVDPADPGVMKHPPRPRGEGVITRRMWGGIFFVGLVMAAGTLLVLDASLPGGLIEGSGTVAYAQTMAFTTLVLFQLFNVFNARSDEESAFVRLLSNGWLWVAIGVSLLLHVGVIYTPFLQQAFSTVALSLADWLFCAAVASSVLWLRELSKIVTRDVRMGVILKA
jgi:Ca2+-transporting ATPase